MDVKQFLDQYGIATGLLIWIVIREGPNLINWIKERFADQQEYHQELGVKKVETQRLDTLIAMGSKTYLEEQLTIMASESQTQLAEANEFIRKRVWAELDLANQNIELLKSLFEKAPDEVYDKIRDDLRMIAENWKATMIEYRHVQTKMTLIVNVLERLQGKEIDE